MGYEGIVQTPNGPMKVSDGVLRVGQRQLHISKDGEVTDEQDQPIAKVVNGQLVPMQQQAQAEQPQGAA
jgi:hypothetical protein